MNEPQNQYTAETPSCERLSATDSVGNVEERGFISKKDIEEFFDLEAEAAKNKWEATMKLSVKERVRKRKAIEDVYLGYA